ncbi:hypothetical protein BT96DRAFT_926612, partial [Gymnopus androsaceus JB14]
TSGTIRFHSILSAPTLFPSALTLFRPLPRYSHPLSPYSIHSHAISVRFCAIPSAPTLFPPAFTPFHLLPRYFRPHLLELFQMFIHIPSASTHFWLSDHNTTHFLLITSSGGPYTVPCTSEACTVPYNTHTTVQTHLTAWLPWVVAFGLHLHLGARHSGYIGSRSVSCTRSHRVL